MGSRTEVRQFIGYPRGTKDGFFYFPRDIKDTVSTNAQLLEKDYISKHRSKSKIALQELGVNAVNNPEQPSVQVDVLQVTMHQYPTLYCHHCLVAVGGFFVNQTV